MVTSSGFMVMEYSYLSLADTEVKSQARTARQANIFFISD